MPNILLVDDEPLMIKLLELYLEPHEFTCISVSDGLEAINLLKKETVDLVIMDVMMPEKDGWQTTREIRLFSDVPIIMLTARDQAEDIFKSINSGANGHISKPIEEQKLIRYVQSFILEKTEITTTN
jgi:DNA-binding response OmpR family regulator